MKFSDMKEVGKDGKMSFPNNGHTVLVCFNPTKKEIKVSFGGDTDKVAPNDGFVITRLSPAIYNDSNGKFVVKADKGTTLAMINI